MVKLSVLAFAALLLAPLAMAQPYAAPRNSFGQPDLTGLWTNATRTTLERDTRLGEQLTLPANETARPVADENPVMTVNGEQRTSFIVAPANGRLPDLSPQLAKMRAERLASSPRGAGFGRGDNPESYTLAERCLKDFGSSSGPPMMPIGYNNTYQIVQTGNHVMILIEMIHDVRVIPLTSTHRNGAIRQWMGDSIGRYDGDTLIVETTNFRSDQAFAGGPADLKLIETFRRVSDTQVLYSFEVNDTRVFTAPLKAEIAMNATKGPLFEYACHEGNYSFGSMLAGQRAADAENAALMAKRK